MIEITSAHCKICGKQFKVPLGPESYSLGRHALSDHLLSEHTKQEIVLVYAGGVPWYELLQERNEPVA